MANEKNLKPFNSDQNREEAVKNGQKGGINSGKARRKKVELKKVVSDMLNSKVAKYPALAEIAEKYGLEDKTTIKELISLGAMLKAAVDGSANELLKLMEIIGENGAETSSDIEDVELKVVFVDNYGSEENEG